MSNFKIRKGRLEDINDIIEIYNSSRKYMRETGNMTQWNDGYPSLDDILKDINAGNNYVGEENGEIIMTFAFILGDDPTYKIIEKGKWLNNLPYGTIHRLGSNGKKRGMLKRCVEFCFNLTDNIRLDTHSDNSPMLKAIDNLGFIRCGIIYCRDGSPRIAFQKIHHTSNLSEKKGQ